MTLHELTNKMVPDTNGITISDLPEVAINLCLNYRTNWLLILWRRAIFLTEVGFD